MKTDYQNIINELTELCNTHHIVLVGTCGSEGIFGEISIVDSYEPDTSGWYNIKEQLDSTVEEYQGNYTVNSIGELR